MSDWDFLTNILIHQLCFALPDVNLNQNGAQHSVHLKLRADQPNFPSGTSNQLTEKLVARTMLKCRISEARYLLKKQGMYKRWFL